MYRSLIGHTTYQFHNNVLSPLKSKFGFITAKLLNQLPRGSTQN